MKLTSPAASRNSEPLLAVLDRVLPSGLILEVASGTGQHAAFMARRMPDRVWQPSDVDDGSLRSIEAWRAESGVDNLRPPVALDATSPRWPVERADAVVNANMIHISPWQVCLGLLDGAARVLPAGALLVMYGPHFMRGRETAPSNLAFDQSLRDRDPSWGIRWLHDVVAAADERGLELDETVDMPANNIVAVYRRR